MEFIVDLQGFKAPTNQFILKEISIIRADVRNSEPVTLCFESPYTWDCLPKKYKITNAWLQRNYHGISWDYGTIPYDAVKPMLQTILRGARAIYVKGAEKSLWLASCLSTEIFDLETLDCPPLKKLPKSLWTCPHHHHHHDPKFNCATMNVKALKSWYYVYHALCERGIFK